MNAFMLAVIIIGALLTVGALVRGLVLLGSGKDVSGEKQNKMMWYRILFQGLTVLAVIIVLLMVGGRS
ncbi:HIG1 domain-containing protein [Pedomonas mirosovicensis]|uniref:HIG1 domain-containing protein n=1 Tax=Pedomonas mirosovicensis TaxID=2908641 RepID=UPI002168C98A|nr:HIG1 domain-containing protein [Pedomonas mirosovicensis]MCH8683833.1 HIG1 domain-containing protein [Pedomonas mirosovicensis]